MTFIEAARAPLGKLTVSSGRASRQEFWSFAVALGLVVFAIAAALRQFAPDLSDILAGPIALGWFLAMWAVAVRRLHDRNMSGAVLLVPLIPVVGVVAFLVFVAMPGDLQANRYGPERAPTHGV